MDGCGKEPESVKLIAQEIKYNNYQAAMLGFNE